MTSGPRPVSPTRLVVVLAAVTAAVSGCSPLPVSEDARVAELSATVTADAHVDVELALGGSRSEADLVRIGSAVGAALLPQASSASIGENPGSYPFVVLDGDAAFGPGPAPVIEWDPAAALDVLAQHGYTDVSMRLTTPAVPTGVEWDVPPSESSANAWYWDDASRPGSVPEGTLALVPRPERGLAGVALGVAALAGVALAWFGLRRRRLGWAVAGCLAAWMAMIATLAAGGIVQMESLAVAGYVSGLPYRLLSALPVMTIPAAVAAAVLAGLTRGARGLRVSPG